MVVANVARCFLQKQKDGGKVVWQSSKPCGKWNYDDSTNTLFVEFVASIKDNAPIWRHAFAGNVKGTDFNIYPSDSQIYDDGPYWSDGSVVHYNRNTNTIVLHKMHFPTDVDEQ